MLFPMKALLLDPRPLDVKFPNSLPESQRKFLKMLSFQNGTEKNYVDLRSSRLQVFGPRKFNWTAKLILNGKSSETGDLGNQMFIFHSTVAIANVHGMRLSFAKKQLKMLNDVFDIAEYTLPTFNKPTCRT